MSVDVHDPLIQSPVTLTYHDTGHPARVPWQIGIMADRRKNRKGKKEVSDCWRTTGD